ncbi:interference hedgehog isoform X3 [Anoplophora glabripennis]|uniref:interference hedgehog isoform X3 n=1 Tax=Anoplophora glabripennis TaxID=217634 RepID=UPI000875538D|nr:interference hedgehog isoform X3 [Anoplophora glabripennis]
MEGTHVFGTILIASVVVFDLVQSDFEYMVTNPEPISVSFGFDTLLTCEMNIEPDRFQWKFYPTDEPYSLNNAINLSNATFHLIPEEKYTKQRKKSSLTVQVNSTKAAGDYQCLAYYGAYVVASVPWLLRIATLKPFPKQDSKDITTTAGNTVLWRCIPPESNPEPYIDYYKSDQYVASSNPKIQSESLVLPNVTVDKSGVYKCSASNTLETVNSDTSLSLKVVKNAPTRSPYFITEPKSKYVSLKGDKVFLECSAIGNPVPKVVWFKKNGRLPDKRSEMLDGGLSIVNITSSDDGVYVCSYSNSYGSISHHITLVYNEEPAIDCLMNSTDVKQGENIDLNCIISGVPEPYVSWFINGFSVSNDTAVEAVGNKIYFRPVEKRHAGNLQVFARNKVRTVYTSIIIRVIPLTSSVDLTVTPEHTHRRHGGRTSSTRKPFKHGKVPKLVPPSKPIISRLNDQAVVVRWSVPNNNGLPISFFKVQYREIGPANSNDLHTRNKGSKWKTTNADIAPNIQVYDVTNLKADHIYKFRIAAVYSNNDNKLSPNSDKFHLRMLDFDTKNPLPIPIITHTEVVNATSVKIYWECSKSANVSVDGFYISYMSASTAGDYMKATVDGENTREYVITHLQPDTIYDIKLQSFNSKFASDFSPIMKARTGTNQSSMTTTTHSPIVAAEQKEAGFGNLYVIIIGAVGGCVLLICGIVSIIICRKWKKNKSDNRDKSTVEDRHVAEGNEYVEYGQKSRANGCVLPSNRITITPNPLAEADNKRRKDIDLCKRTKERNF